MSKLKAMLSTTPSVNAGGGARNNKSVHFDPSALAVPLQSAVTQPKSFG